MKSPASASGRQTLETRCRIDRGADVRPPPAPGFVERHQPRLDDRSTGAPLGGGKGGLLGQAEPAAQGRYNAAVLLPPVLAEGQDYEEESCSPELGSNLIRQIGRIKTADRVNVSFTLGLPGDVYIRSNM